MLRTRILPAAGVFKPLTEVLCLHHSAIGAATLELCCSIPAPPVAFLPSQSSQKQPHPDDSSAPPTRFMSYSSKFFTMSGLRAGKAC